MKKIVTTPAVDIALQTLGPSDVRQVHAWFDHLANWDTDPFVRQNSHVLPDIPEVLMFRTSSDFRIFFSIQDDTITVRDVAKMHAILATAGMSGGR